MVVVIIAVVAFAVLAAWAGMRQRRRGGEALTRLDIEFRTLRRGLSKDMNPGRDDGWTR